MASSCIYPTAALPLSYIIFTAYILKASGISESLQSSEFRFPVIIHRFPDEEAIQRVSVWWHTIRNRADHFPQAYVQQISLQVQHILDEAPIHYGTASQRLDSCRLTYAQLKSMADTMSEVRNLCPPGVESLSD